MCANTQVLPVDAAQHSVENGEYLMISRLDIRNFRCFRNLSLEGLRRLNVIVGESGSGKTALLESMFLMSAGSPEAYFRLRRWRGFGEGAVELNGTRDSFESLFLYLFHKTNKGAIAHIGFLDSEMGRRSLDIAFEGQRSLSVDFTPKGENSVNITPINFKWDVKNMVTNVTLEIKDGQIKGQGSADVFPLHFISSKNMSSKFDSQLFSSLSRSMNLDEILEVIKKSFPTIEGLSLEISSGETLIHAQVKGFAEKIPVNELSGGLNKYLSIAVAIASNRNGVVCIDELENGFFHSHQKDIVRHLIQLCDHYNVQMFASTHSWEMLKAIASVMWNTPEKLSLLKAKYQDNESIIRKLDGASAIEAIADEVEIRN